MIKIGKFYLDMDNPVNIGLAFAGAVLTGIGLAML